MAHLVIDNREHGLIRHLVAKCTPHRVAALPVGDVLCTYDAGGCSWIMERKRADDFSASIQDGRWREQTSRLMATGHRVFFVIEGDLRGLDNMYGPTVSAMVNASLRSSSCCFRTMDVEETACFVVHLVKKLSSYPSSVVAAGLRPPPQSKSKRQRASEADSVLIRQLMCIPSVSERIAEHLVQRFGDLEALQTALRDVPSFPRIQIGAKTFLGKARIAKLAKHLLRADAVC
jgi:ERCC4-type nuclease